mmetsp:Transcript_10956/g.28851  ORF Transcript_10956/g.28851 Transcript_10956/m.28851 type:complete len:91 (-) Transcript_10956:384-656(-)
MDCACGFPKPNHPKLDCLRLKASALSNLESALVNSLRSDETMLLKFSRFSGRPNAAKDASIGAAVLQPTILSSNLKSRSGRYRMLGSVEN